MKRGWQLDRSLLLLAATFILCKVSFVLHRTKLSNSETALLLLQYWPQMLLADAAAAGSPPAPLLPLMDALFLRTLLPQHPSWVDGLSPLARGALYLRGNWLRMPPLMLARHLFHKAFISARPSNQEQI